jgi:hypothetical protein
MRMYLPILIEYPIKLKIATIRPIYKQGSHLDYTNYRPISILSIINKIVEKIVVEQISIFLEANGIVADAQHGFRRGRSTETALSRFAEVVNRYLDERKHIGMLFIDFKKAFDTLDHDLLLQSMSECGIRGPVNAFFKNYLKDRTLRTVVNGVSGEEACVTSGVPTGSVYGPVGYIMHVNSMSNVIRHCKIYMYADDTCLLYAGKDLCEVERKIQIDFENILKWSHDNGIILNVGKTKVMHVCSPYMPNLGTKISIIGHTYDCLHNDKAVCACVELETVTEYKYLGLIVDINFSWKNHITHLCNKLRIMLGKFYHLKNTVNKKTLFVVYHALVESLIGYGLSVYGRTFPSYISKVKSLQIRFLKQLVSKKVRLKFKNNYDQLYGLCRVLPVQEKFRYLIAVDQYDCNDYKIPRHVNTRSLRLDKRPHYAEPRSCNYYGERTLQYLTPRIFNNLPFLCNDIISKAAFKNKLKNTLLESYRNESI